MKYLPIWMAIPFFATTLEVAASQEPQMLAEPPEIIDPPWLESRRQAQLATIDQFEVFCHFNFSDQIAQSGIHFRNKVVDDSGKYWQPVHYDHGNGLAIADVNGDGRSDLLVGKNWKELLVFLGVPGPELLARTPQKVAVAMPNDERNARLVDLNKDNKQDILIYHPSATDPHRVTLLVTR